MVESPVVIRHVLLIVTLAVTVQTGLAQEAVTNQRLFDTGPFLPEHYASRMDQFEAQPVETGQVMFLGDSITEGGDWAELVGDEAVINRGISGDVTFGVLERLDDVIRRRPAKLFLLIGINDIGKDIPEEVIADNVRKIAERMRTESPESEMFIQSVLPVNPSVPRFPQHYDKETKVVRLNQLLRQTADAAGVRFINLFPLFLDRQERLDARLTIDGLHLNDAGYEVWVEYLKEIEYLQAP